MAIKFYSGIPKKGYVIWLRISSTIQVPQNRLNKNRKVTPGKNNIDDVSYDWQCFSAVLQKDRLWYEIIDQAKQEKDKLD